MQDNDLRFLGLARRARRLEVGEEPVGAACRAGHARLVLIASDASDHTFRRAQSFCRSGKPHYLRLPFTKEEMGGALGLGMCALCAYTDPALALAFLKSLEPNEAYAPALDELERQTARVVKRREEEKAHLKKTGRKPKPRK